MSQEKALSVVHLKTENRDGTLYVSSDDLPGLYVWGNDPEDVFEKVKLTIRELFRLNQQLDVSVKDVESGVQQKWFGRVGGVLEVFPTDKQVELHG